MSDSRRDSAALAVGSAVNGALAYVVFSLASHALGAEAAAVSVLWTFWAFTAAAVTFPAQHWITRPVIAHGEGAVRRVLHLFRVIRHVGRRLSLLWTRIKGLTERVPFSGRAHARDRF